jgi:hypothetical protein
MRKEYVNNYETISNKQVSNISERKNLNKKINTFECFIFTNLIEIKMKKKILFCLIALLAANSYAQKNVNIDNLRFTYTYRELPNRPLNPMFFYYYPVINIPNSMVQVSDIDYLYDRLRIDGQRKADVFSDDCVRVEVSMENIIFESTDIKEYVTEEKDKDGNVTERKRSYSAIVTYTFAAYSVTSYQGKDIAKYSLYTRFNPLKYESPYFRTSKEASEYWRNNRDNLKEKFTLELTQDVIQKVSTNLSSMLGFPIRQTNDLIKTINEKKHPENEAFRTASNQLKNKLEAITPNVPLQEEDVADLIEYYKNIPERYTDPSLKADVRLRYAAYYNLCKIYLYLEQPYNVKPYANLILSNGHDTGDCKKMIEAAEKLSERLNASDIVKTRNFNPDDYFEPENEPLPDSGE